MRPADFQDLLKKSWVDGGRGPEGFDCVGLWMEWGRRAGVVVEDPELRCAEVSADLDPMAHAPVGWAEIASSEAVEDDVLMFARDGAEAHLGMVLAEGKVLHCSRVHGVSFAPLHWCKKKATRAFRYFGSREKLFQPA